MGNCKDCKYWMGNVRGFEAGSHADEHGRTECSRLIKGSSLVLINVDDDAHVTLETAPDFGCVLFEPIPEPELSPLAENARKWCG